MMVTIWDLQTMQDRVNFLQRQQARDLEAYHTAVDNLRTSTNDLNDARGRLKDLQREEREDRVFS